MAMNESTESLKRKKDFLKNEKNKTNNKITNPLCQLVVKFSTLTSR